MINKIFIPYLSNKFLKKEITISHQFASQTIFKVSYLDCIIVFDGHYNVPRFEFHISSQLLTDNLKILRVT